MLLLTLLTFFAFPETEIRNFGGMLVDQNTDSISDFLIVESDKLGLLGKRTTRPFWLETPIQCIPIKRSGIYRISIRAIWAPDPNTGLRELSIRFLRKGIWFTFAQNITSISEQHPMQEQRVQMRGYLQARDCIGVFSYYSSVTPEIGFGVTSFKITRQHRGR